MLKPFIFSLLVLAPVSNAFAQTCDDRILVAGIGDILVHDALQIEAHRSPEKFFVLWKNVAPYISAADVAYGNLEAPVAPGILANGQEVADPGFVYDRKVYHGTNMKFNFHPQVITDIQKLGIDVISTANNHALDRKAIGIDKTIFELQKKNMPFTGTRMRNGDGEWGVVTEVKGKKIFWLSCTDHLNGHEDSYNQVLKCFKNENTVTHLVQNAVSEYDAVILTPHWGPEYVQAPNIQQKKWAAKMARLGVTAIIGSHPHVLQPVERIEATLVAYSLGNFVAWQKNTERKTSVVLFLDLQMNHRGKLQVVDYKGLPIYRVGQITYAAFDQINGAALSYVSRHLGHNNIVMGQNFSEITRCQLK